MVDNKSKTSLIGHMRKNISLMKINNIIMLLRTCIILSSFVIYFFCICLSGSIILLGKERDICVKYTLHDLDHSLYLVAPYVGGYFQCLRHEATQSITTPINRMLVCRGFTSLTTVGTPFYTPG